MTSAERVEAARAAAPARSRLELGCCVALLGAGLGWSYWPTLVGLVREWQSDPNYSVGALVPVLVPVFLWRKRRELAAVKAEPGLLGLAGLLAAQIVRFSGLLFPLKSVERYSLVLTVAAIVLLVGGRSLFRAARWVLVFLVLMVPLPLRVHDLISPPLQGLAASAAVYALEILGFAVIREGNVMMLGEGTTLAVAEACSGLRMLSAFVVVTAALAFLVARPPGQKAVLLVSSVPVALVCNAFRLVVTAMLFVYAGSEVADRFFHDFAGLTMMPLAIALLLAELWVMQRLVEPDSASGADARG